MADLPYIADETRHSRLPRRWPTVLDENLARAFVVKCVTIELWVLFFTQKIAIPFGGSARSQVALALIIHFVTLGILGARGCLRVTPLRAVIYLIFIALAFLVHLRLPTGSYSLMSAIQVALIFSTYMFILPVTRLDYTKITRTFANIAILASIFMHICWLSQAVGLGVINVEQFIPNIFIYKYFNYINPLHWGSPWVKPHGIVFPEVAMASQFVALGLIVELYFFRRIWALASLGIALFLSFSGTGMMLFIFSLPAVVYRIETRYMILAALCLPLALIVAANLGALDNFTSRSDEFGKSGSSGYTRFVLPLEWTAAAMQGDTAEMLFGRGAGSMPKAQATADGSIDFDTDYAWPAYSKVFSEYGALVFVFWLALILLGTFRPGIPFPISYSLFLMFNVFNAALGVPLMTIYVFLLAGGYLIVDQKK